MAGMMQNGLRNGNSRVSPVVPAMRQESRPMSTRMETDSLGAVAVPAECYWGAQTQRSLQNFRIGEERMPLGVVRAFGAQKKAAALANLRLGKLDGRLAEAIVRAADEVIQG